jgi:hypothetical protein
LREGAPSPLGPAEVKGRRGEPAGGKQGRERERGKAETAAGWQQSERSAEPEQQKQRKAGTLSRGEEHNRQRGMHAPSSNTADQRDSSRSTHRSRRSPAG